MSPHAPRLRTLLLGLSAATLLLLPACSSGDDGAAADAGPAPTTPSGDVDLSGVTLRIGDLQGFTSAAFDAAGQLDDVPYEIEWAEFPSGPPAVEAMNADALDVASMADTPEIFAVAGGVETSIVAGSLPADPEVSQLQLLAPEDSGIETVADLEGRSVAAADQTVLQYFLIAALAEEGLDLDDIDPVNLQPADANSAYASGDVDAFVGIEPLSTIATQQVPSTVVAESADYFLQQGAVVARNGALEDGATSAAIGDFVQRQAATSDWIVGHPDDAAALFSDVLGLPPELASVSIGVTGQQWVPLDDAYRQRLQDQADAFIEAGHAPEGLDLSSAVDDRFNDLLATAPAAAG
jgi:sulfonate transport system substrate-binding protein